jgi:hypothetical protein
MKTQSEFKIKAVKGDFSNRLTGRNNIHAFGIFNSKGEVLAIDGKAYFPIGGRLALNAILEGGLDNPGYSFIKY